MIRDINRNVKRLNDFLYGFQEYVAVARRAPDGFEGALHPDDLQEGE